MTNAVLCRCARSSISANTVSAVLQLVAGRLAG